MKKIISIFLMLSMTSVIGSCGNNSGISDTSADKTPSTAKTTELTAPAPEINNYNGYEFRIGCKKIDSNIYSICSSEMTGEVYNDALYERKMKIEDLYNVKLIEISNSDDNIFGLSVTAGSDEYDLYVVQYLATNMNQYVSGGMVYDLNTLGIDMTTPWWDKSSNDQIEIDGHLYCGFSDFTLGLYDSIIALAFVKDLMAEYSDDDPYQLVLDHKWTIDIYNNMLTDVTNDINGDSVMDSRDRWGTVSGRTSSNAFYIGFGGKFVEEDSGNYDFTFFTSPKTNYIDKVFDVMFNKENFQITENLTLGGSDNDVWAASQNIFNEGRMLFRSSTLSDLRGYRDMELDFGILPYPLYDETQDEYYSYPHFLVWMANAAVIPVTVTDTARSANILDALSYYSTGTTREAYYDNVLTGKTARDNESSQMIDIIFDNVVLDLGIFYNFGGILNFLPDLAINENRDYTSKMAQVQVSTVAAMNSFLDNLK